MITTITLSPAIDRTILTPALEYGLVNRVGRGRENIGGKGINVSKVLEQLGTKSVAIGFLGALNKNKTEKMIEGDGVKHDFVYLDDVTRTNVVIVEVDKHSTTNINEVGFAVDETSINAFKEKMMEYAKISNFMVFSGSVPKGMDETVYYDLLTMVKGKTDTLLDADDDYLIEGLKASPTIIKPNIHELENAFDMELKSDVEVVALCRKIIDDYGIKYTLISMGGDGSLLVTKDEAYKAEPVEVEVRNTVGAGDSMVGGFLHGLSEGMTLENCLRYGSACGTLAVMTEANQIISEDDLQEMIHKIVISSTFALGT